MWCGPEQLALSGMTKGGAGKIVSLFVIWDLFLAELSFTHVIQLKTWAPKWQSSVVDGLRAGGRGESQEFKLHLCKLWSDVLAGPCWLLLHTPHLLTPFRDYLDYSGSTSEENQKESKKLPLPYWKCGFLVASGQLPSRSGEYTLVE